MSSLWRWERGRQGGGYEKFCLFSSKTLRMDAYLLRFPRWSRVDTHQDPTPEGFEHHRLNIVLREPEAGGEFYTLEHPLSPRKFNTHRIVWFRPDQLRHGLTQVMRGSALWLSVGWLRKENA